LETFKIIQAKKRL